MNRIIKQARYEKPDEENNDTPFYARRTRVEAGKAARKAAGPTAGPAASESAGPTAGPAGTGAGAGAGTGAGAGAGAGAGTGTGAGDYLSSPHWHENVEIIHVLTGSIVMYASRVFHTLSAGETLLIRSEDIHAAKIDPGDSCEYLLLKFHPDILVSTFQHTEDRIVFPLITNMDSEPPTLLLKADETKNFPFCEWMQTAYEAYRWKGIADNYIMKTQVHLIMLPFIERNLEFVRQYAEDKCGSIAGLLSIRQLNDYIRMHLKEGIRPSEASRMCNMSYSAFARFIKQVTGGTLTDYTREIRLEVAEKLLLLSGLNINEIAFKCGFQGANYFIRVFKRKYGCPPLQFKKLFHKGMFQQESI
ncbi:MAG TPA: hypothetical protein DD727_00595 [Clostridiales bacterium]|nr:hypothetical protein [Clostridiales bacterium]